MRFKVFYLAISIFFCGNVISQSNTISIIPPDSIKKICNKLLISELGEKMFHVCVKFEKQSGIKRIYTGNAERLEYKLEYKFSFPSVKEATVAVSFLYSVYLGKGHLQSELFLRKDKTDLPANTKNKGLKIIGFNKALEIALSTDTMLLNNKTKVHGAFLLRQDSFYWYFSYGYPSSYPNGDAEKFIEHNVYIEPYNGKVKSSDVH